MYQNIYIQRINKQKICHIWDDRKGYYVVPFKNYCYIKNQQGEYKTIYGDSVSKISSWSKYQWPNLFEADVPADTRMLVDLYLDSDEISDGHREAFFDIEVEHEEKYPDIEKADMEITSIALYERTLDEYYVFILDRNDAIEPYEEDGVVVMPFLHEEDLLESFLNKWQEMNPSIISGWNIDYFDIPYLYRRLRRVLGITAANSLSPIGKVTWNKYRERYFLAGISCLDYISLYKKFSYIQLHSYALDAVARHELNKGKILYDGDLNKLFKENIKKFIKYNLVDVQLVVELDNKLNFIELVRGVCHKGHVPYEDIFFSSRWIEGAMLTFMKRKGLVAPNRNAENKDGGEHEKFTGAYVKSPEAAKFRWLFDLDFTSLYPSIMTTLNISPETKVGKVLNWNAHDWVRNSIKKFEVEIIGEKEKYNMTPVELKTLLDDANLSVSAIGILYKKSEKGLIPQILDEWFKDKNKFDKLSAEWEIKGDEEKAKYYEDRRTIAKVMLNSIYGVLGLPKFRFYDIDNAESVTTTGQLLLKFAEKMANHYYNQILDADEDYCIYMDTDSLFLLAAPLIKKLYPTIDMNDDAQMSEKILEITSQVQTYLNSSFDLFSKRFLHSDKHYFDIKQEVIARTGLWTAKKRYALHVINKKGIPVDKIDVKGLDVIRSTFPLAFRAFMKGLLKDFLKDVSQKEIDVKVLEMKDKIPHTAVALIATPTGVKNLSKYGKPIETWDKAFGNWIKGAPVHVKAALSYNEMLRHLNLHQKFPDIKEGEKIRWVYLKTNMYGLDTLAFKGYDDPEEILSIIEEFIDRKRIFEKVLKKKLMDFYVALKWSFPTKGEKIINKFFTY